MTTSAVMGFDMETSSLAPLQSVGARAYLAHTSTVALMAAYHIIGDPSPPRLWCRGDPVPEELIKHVHDGGKFSGWNVIGFDRIGYRLLMEPLGFPPIPDDNWLDSMHLAAAANLPRSLDGAAKAVGMRFEVDLKDTNRIRRITDQKRTPLTFLPNGRVLFGDRVNGNLKPAQIDAFDADMAWLRDRCVQDVTLEEGVLLRLPPWPDMKPWLAMPAIDRRINDRGVFFDSKLAEGFAKAAAEETRRLGGEMAKVTGKAVTAVTQIESLKQWLISRKVELPRKDEALKQPEDDAAFPRDVDEENDFIESEAETKAEKGSPWRLRKSDIADLLARDDIPEDCKIALAIRSEAAKSSLAKLRSMLNSRDESDTLYGAFILGGAQQTMRWSGSRWQPHNFVRDVFGNPDEIAEKNGLDGKKDKAEIRRLGALCLNTAIEVGRSGDSELMRALYEMPRRDAQGRVQMAGILVWMSRMMRRIISARKGRLLLNGDFAQIEARITVWLSQQMDMLNAFANREDVYKVAAAGIYKIAMEAITKQMRQAGKVSILAAGFGGGPHALMAMAYNYGLILSLQEATSIIKAWREANAATKEYWYATDDAAAMAVQYPGREFFVPPLGLVSYFTYGDCLCCRLPSGRLLRYWQPRLHQEYWGDGRPKDRLSLSGIAIKGRAMFRRSLYHTILCENQVQGIAADLIGEVLANLDDTPFPAILHVHDNAASEIGEDLAESSLPAFENAFLRMPDWTRGLPIAVDAEIGSRFG